MRLPFLGRSRPIPADLAPLPVPPPAAPKAAAAGQTALTPPVPSPVFQPGRYVVTYDPIGQHGDRLTGLRRTPPPLTTRADTAADLAEQIRTDIDPWIGGGHRIEVTVDMAVSGGMIRCGSVSGAFTFVRGGVR